MDDFGEIQTNHPKVSFFFVFSRPFAAYGINRGSLPNGTACVRRRAPSLSKTRLRCVFTVFFAHEGAVGDLLCYLRPCGNPFQDFQLAGVMPSDSDLALRRARRWPAPATVTSRTTTVSVLRVSLRPSQMPKSGEHRGSQPAVDFD